MDDAHCGYHCEGPVALTVKAQWRLLQRIVGSYVL